MIGWRCCCCCCWSGSHPVTLGPVPPSSSSSSSAIDSKAKPLKNRLHITGLVPLALSLSFAFNLPTPSLAIPSLNSPFASPTPSLPTTPFSQSKDLPLGLQDDGKIRPCPSVNPGCISSNPKSSSFAFPWSIPDSSSDNPLLKLKEAILQTQKNPKFLVIEDTPYGNPTLPEFTRPVAMHLTYHFMNMLPLGTQFNALSESIASLTNLPLVNTGQYLQAEVDGGFGRDVLEFLVKDDVVAYRCMAAKVTYVYPFTTALGDSKGQEERLKKITDQLGWYAPSFDSMD